jgi:hypothetical protein
MSEFYERLDKELARDDLDGIAIADVRVMRHHLKHAIELLEATIAFWQDDELEVEIRSFLFGSETKSSPQTGPDRAPKEET